MGLTRSDWTLLVLAESGKPLKKVDFQKALFLLGKLLPDEAGSNFFQFVPHKFGPFAKSAYDEAESLVANGFALDGPQEFAPTDAGIERAKSIQKSEDVQATIAKVVAWVEKQPFEVLCQRIYTLFPEMKEKSVITPLPSDPKSMPLIEMFEALSKEERADLDRAAALGKATGGDIELELAFRKR